VGKIRSDVLGALSSSSTPSAIALIDYNANRPHSRLGWLTPSEFALRFVQDKQRLLGAASLGSAPIAVASTAQTGNHVLCPQGIGPF